ncbi:RadC family protein [Tenacibaculum maritimum]|uniref:DNA repair protein RadC n=1 Tax=Tenacibaculum maritimum NCIMB 2154 TaxID=1349785 RepID=A0A2H1ECG3_9FLAO|nr:DNA repair protein RadC [Tenacibaculum maritimum]MCD9563019.1 DNA repair protein RadC [Tenacibaculum maritimum]MCD9566123.1 DNA repair protein RadC [Tenacibaculum maritimum]MCD9579521.1 DNA repair protein RadC [Tenacibaculum maritimum]MCD9580624.1 DNA repair protein RadC [Tenacibaculum maritimum]MCD9585371.1 DNA repair protein RadC [Tenacibaculum maritimum]
MKKLTIKSWALDDRPREKLLAKGQSNLSDTELIAILIGSGNRKETAVALSQRILQSVGNNLRKLARLSVAELTKFNGIGEAKAISIITALELGRRRQFENALKKTKIMSSSDVFKLMRPIIGDLEYEEFWVLYLNNSNKVLAKHKISKGGLTATLVDVRPLYKRALELSCIGMIVCHNHPSGRVKPSESDIKITKKIKEAGTFLDIKLLDHLIIAEKIYFSFADEGIL